MNFITFEAAFCLYPEETVEAGKALFLDLPGKLTKQFYQHYKSGGIEHVLVASGQDFQTSRPRWVEDKYTWMHPLRSLGHGPDAPRHIDPIRVTTWSLGTTLEERHWLYYHEFQPGEPHVSLSLPPLVIAWERFADYISAEVFLMSKSPEEWPDMKDTGHSRSAEDRWV